MAVLASVLVVIGGILLLITGILDLAATSVAWLFGVTGIILGIGLILLAIPGVGSQKKQA